MCTVGQHAIHSSCRSRPLGIATYKSSPTFSPLLCCIPLCAVAVRHCLLALPGVEKGDIKRVLSHPQVCGGKMAAWQAGRCGSTERCGRAVAWHGVVSAGGCLCLSCQCLNTSITALRLWLLPTLQALAQTDSYTRRMPGVVREAVDDTGAFT